MMVQFNLTSLGRRYYVRLITLVTTATLFSIYVFYVCAPIWSGKLSGYECEYDSNLKDKSEKLVIECLQLLDDGNQFRIDFDKYPNHNITGFPHPIVPDIVHLIHFGKSNISFVEMITIRSIVDNHNPARIFIHCNYCNYNNNTMEGKYWDMLGDKYHKIIQVVYAEEPREIFGQQISSVFHASDVARIKILMKYGGIFLDNDIYVVKGLHGFRHYEMVLGWDDGQYLGTQVLIAHKDARFLKYWLDSYHNYHGEEWYFNAGEYPTTSVLYKRPELVHRVKYLFGVHMLFPNLYHANWPAWIDQYSIHLLISHRPYLDENSSIKTFNEDNIKTYNATFGQMARFTLYGNTDMVCVSVSRDSLCK